MSEKPILFNSEMVNAILEGRKTQTRRVLNPRDMNDFVICDCIQDIHGDNIGKWSFENENGRDCYFEEYCPYGAVGDSLYVRESWRTHKRFDHLKPSELSMETPIFYEASDLWIGKVSYATSNDLGKLRPSIFMPKWCSRIKPKITDIRVERVADINWNDSECEGVCSDDELGWSDYTTKENNFVMSPMSSFQTLWDSINAKRKDGIYSWSSNPWVWAVTFEVVK